METEQKAILVKKIRRRLKGAVVFRHEDLFTAGIPDISVTYRGTTWIEVKFVSKKDGRLKKRKLQHFVCENLEDNGDCWYVIYEDHKIFGPRTHVIRPSQLENWNGLVTTHFIVNGFDHDAVIEEIFGGKLAS